MADYKTNAEKGFWSRPEGTTGAVFIMGILGVLGYGLFKFSGPILAFLTKGIGMAVGLGVLGLVLYMILDPKTRNLFSYMYQSVMRKITSIFVTIDPIGILKNYISDLESNLKKMGKQIGGLKGQMRNLKMIVENNNKDIENNLALARKAKQMNNEKQMILSTRKAARLKESNGNYTALHWACTVYCSTLYLVCSCIPRRIARLSRVTISLVYALSLVQRSSSARQRTRLSLISATTPMREHTNAHTTKPECAQPRQCARPHQPRPDSHPLRR